ncbi:MAG: hypothetical protein Q7Q73_18190 [Verrucomicrobiota bacterium JB024]|nr:hypothetical protein [Verrucomicrobiota bacterium JB024]
MASSTGSGRVFIDACDCLSALGDAASTHERLCAGEIALKRHPVLDEGSERVPLALTGPMAATTPPRWLQLCVELAKRAPDFPWGTEKFPIVVSSSNFGIDQMLAAHQSGEERFHGSATPAHAVETLARACGWGPNRFIVSNACVSAQLALIQAERLLGAGLAERVLVFSFDFLSPFVAGGFHALKILNSDFPQPYTQRESGSIGLGDGAAFAVLSREPVSFRLAASAALAENYHMTANEPSGVGFRGVLERLAPSLPTGGVWVKGHGTGTLEAGRLEAEAVAWELPKSPLVGWKGSLGHTLGSCGLVELAVALVALRTGMAPGTVGAEPPFFTDNVHRENVALGGIGGVILLSSAFGGAQAAHLVTCD